MEKKNNYCFHLLAFNYSSYLQLSIAFLSHFEIISKKIKKKKNKKNFKHKKKKKVSFNKGLV